jgi:non-heme chloroperoxidase
MARVREPGEATRTLVQQLQCVRSRYRGLASIVFVALIVASLDAQDRNNDRSSHKVSSIAVEKDIRLEVLDWGGSGRPIVLLAGLGGTAHVFDNFAPKLTGYGHVLGLTRRGFGASTAPESGYSVSRFAQDLLEALKAPYLKNAVLIGHSFGGEELTRAAGVQSNRIAGLVYLDAAIDQSEVRKMGANQLDGMRRAMQMKENAWRELLSSMTPPDYHNIQAPAIAFFAVPKAATDSLERGIEIMKNYPDLEGSATERKMSASYKMLEAYRNNDPMVRQSLDMSFAAYRAATENNIKLFRTGVPHGRVVELIGAHHLIYLSNHADVLRELDHFMRDLP